MTVVLQSDIIEVKLLKLQPDIIQYHLFTQETQEYNLRVNLSYACFQLAKNAKGKWEDVE